MTMKFQRTRRFTVALCLSAIGWGLGDAVASAQTGTAGPDAAPTAAPSATPPPPSSLGPTDAPASAKEELGRVNAELDQVDRLLLEGKADDAKVELGKTEERLKAIQESHAAAMPPGFVPLFVAEERVAALRRQLDDPPPSR